MDGENFQLFFWEHLLFVAYIAGSQLILSWRGIDSVQGRNSVGNKCDGKSSDRSSSSSDDDDSMYTSTSRTNLRHFKDSATETHTTSFELSKWSDCQVIAARPMFDTGLLKKHQVLVLKCANVESDSANFEYLFIQVREMPSPLLNVPDTRCQTSIFSLTVVQSYSFNTSHNLTWHKHLALLPDFQLLFVHPDSMTIMLCAPDRASSHGIQLKDPSLTAVCKNISDVEILDALSVTEDRTVIALVSYKDADQILECQCLKFSPNRLTSHNSTEGSYNMDQLPLDVLFAAHYTEIMKAASVSTFTSTYSLTSESRSFHSSLTMLTQTGYALKFEAGVLKCCVNLTVYSDMIWSSDSWSRVFVKVINFDGCPDRAAVQVDSTCHLIDWTTEKVVKTWQSVSAAISSDVHLCGLSSLIVVFQPETTNSPGTITCRQLLQESVVAVVDIDDVCADVANGAVLLDSSPKQQGSHQRAEDGHVNQPLCAASALLGQQRQCQQAVSEMESQLSDKLFFLSNTWQQLANLDISADKLLHTTSPDQLSLSVLVEGSVPAPVPHDCRNLGKTFLETGSVWKRLVDSMLVVGVQVRNVSLRQLSDVQISLVPAAHCQTSIIEIMSSLQPSNLAGVVTVQSGQQENTDHTEFYRQYMLPPGSSTIAACGVDISAAVSADDLTLHAFVSYSVLNSEQCPVEESRKKEVSVRHVEEYCAQIVLTPCELLDDLCCIGATRDLAAATLTTTDLLALDCIQKQWSLLVQAVVSSVTCLPLKLSGDPRVRYLQWADQFLFVDSPVLKYSRLQVLESSSKYTSSIQIFARSQSQVLLMVTFLYSILPEDVTITLGTSQGIPAGSCLSGTVLEDIECKITSIKQHLTTASPQDTEISMPPESSLSPKFLSSKQQVRCKAAGSVDPGGEARIQTSAAEGAQRTGGVATEKRLFRVARKRFRDIWGDDDSP